MVWVTTWWTGGTGAGSSDTSIYRQQQQADCTAHDQPAPSSTAISQLPRLSCWTTSTTLPGLTEANSWTTVVLVGLTEVDWS